MHTLHNFAHNLAVVMCVAWFSTFLYAASYDLQWHLPVIFQTRFGLTVASMHFLGKLLLPSTKIHATLCGLQQMFLWRACYVSQAGQTAQVHLTLSKALWAKVWADIMLQRVEIFHRDTINLADVQIFITDSVLTLQHEFTYADWQGPALLSVHMERKIDNSCAVVW